MSDLRIFSALAPAYWEAGYSVVPLEPHSKKPAIAGWTGYSSNLPNEQTRRKWREVYAESGIGLLLGTDVAPGYRVYAIDIDDDDFVAPVSALFGATCRKRGKKGETFFVRVPTGDKIKSSKIPGVDKDVGDLLGHGRMTVMPPSIHPDTGAPYRFVGPALLEMNFAKLPVMDKRLHEVLFRLCSSAHSRTIQGGVQTHDAFLKLVVQLLKAGATDEEITRVITALAPPNYSGDSLKELPEMIRGAREKGLDKNEEDEQTQVMRVLSVCEEANFELFHWHDVAYLSVATKEGGCLCYAMRSRQAGLLIRLAWFKATERSITQNVLGEVVATLETRALFASPARQVWNRVGELDGDVYIDLGRKDGKLVRITKTGWALGFDKRIKFRRPSGQLELPEPQRGGNLALLTELLGLSRHNFLCLAAFLIGALRPEGPYFGLLIEGQQGAGKSFLASEIKALIDPNEADRLRLPENERDLAIHAKEYWLLSYDNSSGMKPEISDLLCVVATGGGMATRRLYTDSELEVFKGARPIVVNGISGFAKRPDLLERTIYVNLARPDKRLTEKELRKNLDEARPKILGALYDAIAKGLERLDETPTPEGIRMADAAQWISAAEAYLDGEPGDLIAAIKRAQDDLVIERVNDDPVTIALRRITKAGPFEGHVGNLFDKLRALEIPNLPRSPAGLSSAIARHTPALEKVGIKVVSLKRTNQGAMIRIEQIDAEGAGDKREIEF